MSWRSTLSISRSQRDVVLLSGVPRSSDSQVGEDDGERDYKCDIDGQRRSFSTLCCMTLVLLRDKSYVESSADRSPRHPYLSMPAR